MASSVTKILFISSVIMVYVANNPYDNIKITHDISVKRDVDDCVRDRSKLYQSI